MRLYRGKMKEQKEEVKVVTKEWKNVSQHDSYEAADKKRKLLLNKNKNDKNFLVKVKRCGTDRNSYVVKTHTIYVAKTHTEQNFRESKYARKKREKAIRRQKRL
jgi:hypothetical protein